MKRILFLVLLVLLSSYVLAQTNGPNEYFFNVGDVMFIWDKAVKLSNVGAEGSIIVEVGGVTEIIASGEMDYVNGLQISATKTLYNPDNSNLRSATLMIIGGPEIEYFFNINNSYFIEGKKVNLLSVESDGSLIDVDNTKEKLSTGITENVNGLIITVTQAYVGQSAMLRVASLTPFNDTSPYNVTSNNIPYNETEISIADIGPYNDTNITRPSYTEKPVIRCDGCLDSNGNCVPVGVRVANEFCNIDKELKPQLEEGIYCDNSFECSSNVCVNNKCIGKGFLEKILAWFMNIFG